MGLFSNLPSDLIYYLINNVDQELDFVQKVRIRAVCSSWNSLLPNIHNHPSEHLPRILRQDNTKGASIYTLHGPQTYPLDLPEIKNKIFKGSSYGWVVTLDDTDGGIDDIYLYNPLTRAQIQLPPRSTFPDIKEYHPDRVGEEYVLNDTSTETNDGYITCKGDANQTYIEKIVLSSSPLSNDCMAVAIFGEFHILAWCRLDHKKWTPFIEYSSEAPQIGFYDVIFHNGKLYALHHTGKLVVYDTIYPEVSFTLVVPEVSESSDVILTGHLYLVECSRLGILLVSRLIEYIDEDDYESLDRVTGHIYIYKLVDSAEKDGLKDWEEIEFIGNNMLFLGVNLSWSMIVTDELESLGYRRNCIYYTDESRTFEEKRDSDIGMYDLEDETNNELPGFNCQTRLFWPPPIWMTPSAN